VVLAAGLGVARIAALRAWGLLAYAGTLLAAAAVLAVSSWPWAEAKTLAIASPVPLTLAGVGVAHLLQTRARALGVAAGVLVAGGVAWSNALAFHETALTPRERHAELERIGERFAGRGPALLPEYDPYGARWFLRRMDAEGASELRPRTVALAEGGTLAKTETADLDRFSLDALREYRTLVVRRSPAASRPPSWFSRVWRGRWYEVWERTGDAGRVVGRLGLGTELDPAGTARCSDVRRLARAAGPGGRLLAATAPAPVVGTLGPGGAPGSWTTAAAGNAVVPDGDGSVRTTVTLPQAGRWAVWLGGAFRGRVRVSVDGRRAGVDRHQLSYDGQWVPFGSLDLVAGPHAVTVSSDEDALRPGSGGGDFAIGPVAFSPATGGRAVLAVPAGRAERLCDRRLDWIDAVR
jgi:hypothetical protein